MAASFNISKTEFLAYLSCPLKYYIIKWFNLHAEEGPRGPRDYSRFSSASKGGMFIHRWLSSFYDQYSHLIPDGSLPEEFEHWTVARLFWEAEYHRYLVDPDHWEPLALELYLRSDWQRGTIDRIDPVGLTGCRIVEYKPSRRSVDWEELLFYALLASESLDFHEQTDRVVEEIGCYCYLQGNFLVRSVTEEDLLGFKDFLLEIKEEILSGHWVRKSDCLGPEEGCDYYIVCKNITL
ncbi:MAG: hypothetical protein GF308_18040 [Candidatus Heimdallarchaeota archaeon]|nr:hypothetical protein [Candidatus Heimdallarchaeota archaeon]